MASIWRETITNPILNIQNINITINHNAPSPSAASHHHSIFDSSALNNDTMKLSAQVVVSILSFSQIPVHGFLPSRRKAALVVNSSKTVSPNVHIGGTVVSASPSRLLFTKQGGNVPDGNQPFIRPAPHNSPLFRAIAILYALLFAIYQGSNSPSTSANATLQKIGKYFILPPNAAATVHLLSFATWFGTVVYTTFVAGITMFKNLPRRVFGTLQSKLFPLYFQLGTIMIGLQVSSIFDKLFSINYFAAFI